MVRGIKILQTLKDGTPIAVFHVFWTVFQIPPLAMDSPPQMNDLFANLTTLEATQSDVFGDLVSLFPDELDEPVFEANENPEIDTEIRLPDDRRFIRRPAHRLFKDYRADPNAYKHLAPLPGPGESLHGIISGKYALYELIPALIEHAGNIAELHIATLSFNKQNASDILDLLDEGRIAKMNLIISYYFKSTSPEIYSLLIPQMRERGHKVLAMRNHCKLILAKMENGTKYVIESSANLRSSVNLEQFVLTDDADLYEFHYQWMNGELLHGKELG
jgi:hypothetical protein